MKGDVMEISTTQGVKLVIAVSILVTGQVLWKLGLNEVGTFSLSQDFSGSFIKILTNLKILSGALLYILSTAIYFDVLAKLPLSLVYPLMSLSYVIALIPAYFILNESITFLRIISVLVIWFGIILLVKS